MLDTEIMKRIGVIIVGIFGTIFILLVAGSWLFFRGTTAIDPVKTGGELLLGTNDISPSGDQNISLSPDGKYLSYVSNSGNMFQPAFVLYETATNQKHPITLSQEAAQLSRDGSGPLGHTGCWKDAFSVLFPSTYTSKMFFIDITRRPFTMEVRDVVDEGEARYAFECPTRSHTLDNTNIARVDQVSEREVRLVDIRYPNNTIALHRAQSFSVSRVAITDVTISPDGTTLAYTFDQYRGFGSFSKGYVLSISGLNQPIPLASQVFGPMRWSPDGEFLYVVVKPWDQIGIYRFSLHDLR